MSPIEIDHPRAITERRKYAPRDQDNKVIILFLEAKNKFARDSRYVDILGTRLRVS